VIASSKHCARKSEREDGMEYEVQEIEIDEQGYDYSGAYWGVGQKLWWIVAYIPGQRQSEDHYLRANSDEEALEEVKRKYL
jgi:hypothetical protein